MLSIVSIVGLAFAIWSFSVAPENSRIVRAARRIFAPPAIAAFVPLALAGSLILEVVFLAEHLRVAGGGEPPWLARLPIPVFDNYNQGDVCRIAWPCQVNFLLAGFQSVALGFFLLAIDRRARGHVRVTIVAAIAICAIVAIGSPFMSSLDPYEYVAASIAGWSAYWPAPEAFSGTVYGEIAHHLPLKGVLYGPLWLGLDIALMSFESSVLAKLYALRAFNAVLVIVVAALAARASRDRRVGYGVALNPAVWFYTVVNPHAEFEGVALMLVATVLAGRFRGWIAAGCIVLAGLIKLPFLICGAVALLEIADARRRFVLWAIAVLTCTLVSFAIGGYPYFAVLFVFSGSKAGAIHEFRYGLYASVIVLVFIVATIATRRTFPAGAVFLGQLVPLATPWYLFWGIPYSIAARGGIPLLVAIPLLAAFREGTNRATPIPVIIVALLIVVLVIDFVWSRVAPLASIEKSPSVRVRSS